MPFLFRVFPFLARQISGFPFKIVKIQLSCLLAFFFVAPLLYFLPGTTFAIWYWYWSLRAHRVRHHNSSHSYRRAAPPTKAPYLTPVLAFQPSSHFTTRLLARSLFPSLTFIIYYLLYVFLVVVCCLFYMLVYAGDVDNYQQTSPTDITYDRAKQHSSSILIIASQIASCISIASTHISTFLVQVTTFSRLHLVLVRSSPDRISIDSPDRISFASSSR